MNLFQSQWLQEPGGRIDRSAYQEPAFGPRYGRRRAPQRTCSDTGPDRETPAGRDLQAERAILRAMARYERGVRA